MRNDDGVLMEKAVSKRRTSIAKSTLTVVFSSLQVSEACAWHVPSFLIVFVCTISYQSRKQLDEHHVSLVSQCISQSVSESHLLRIEPLDSLHQSGSTVLDHILQAHLHQCQYHTNTKRFCQTESSEEGGGFWGCTRPRLVMSSIAG